MLIQVRSYRVKVRRNMDWYMESWIIQKER